ncbi:MAG: class I adenylate-forming enzyme family protein [Candidatus Acidiferrales bacterium]
MGLMDLRRLAASRLREAPEHTAVVFGDTRLSYADFADAVERSASAMAALGIGAGDRVGLLLHNSPELATLYFACFRIGAVAVPTNTRYRRRETEYALNHCEARLLIVDDELVEEVRGIRDTVPTLAHVRVIGDASDEAHRPWAAALEGASAPAPEVAIEDDAPAAIFYTSGSTSRPKGVTHTHRSLASHAESRITTNGLGPDDVWLISSAMVHIAGSAGQFFPAIRSGSTAVIMPRHDPKAYLEHVRRYRPTRSLLLPTLLLDVLDQSDCCDAGCGCFKALYCGGDAVTEEMRERWAAATSAPLLQLLGMTECEAYCIERLGEPRREGSVGPPRAGVELRIVDSSGRDLPPGADGEIVIRSPSMMIGYWEEPEHTAAALRDGWLYTGDRGRMDEDGYVWFVGRSKEIIIRAGSNIAPGEVEDVIEEHPDVLAAAVVGAPDPRLGQIVVAFVEREPGKGSSLTAQELAEWAGRSIAAYKVPERWVFVDRIPRNSVEKVDRAALHAMAGTSLTDAVRTSVNP